MKTRPGIAELIARAATLATILVATPLSARADDLLDDHQHRPLINTGSAKCFEPIGGSTNGLLIQQRTCSLHVIRSTGTIPIQYYQFQSQGPIVDRSWFDWFCWNCISTGPTGYLIRNLDTDLCLDVRDGSKSDGAVVQQWTCNKKARSMLWRVQPGDFPGMFKVRNFNSDRCLDVKGGSSADGAQLQQYHCTSMNLAQNFGQKFPDFWVDTAGNVMGVIDVNGRWTDGSTHGAVIYAGLGSIAIDMSAFGRPAARGTFFGGCFISVNFPDDAAFQGDVSPCFNPNPTKITWSNGSVWTKEP